MVDFIPGGYTSKLQVQDVGINRPFKKVLREEYWKFMTMNNHGLDFQLPKPHRKDLANWVSNAWNTVRTETVIKTWDHIFVKQVALEVNVASNGGESVAIM